MSLRPDTFILTLPDGATKVRCWQRDREQIRVEVETYGDVMLVADNRDQDVYALVPRGTDEWRFRRAGARQV